MSYAISAIEFVGALTILAYALLAFSAILAREGVSRAKMIIAEGALAGLSFKVAASLLKLLKLSSWNSIGLFAVIFCLRSFIKFELNWQRRRIGLGMGATVMPE
jgi:uncharacterized membrane protein